MAKFDGSLGKMGGVDVVEVILAKVLEAVGTLGEKAVVLVVSGIVVGSSPLEHGFLYSSSPLFVLQTVNITQLEILVAEDHRCKALNRLEVGEEG